VACGDRHGQCGLNRLCRVPQAVESRFGTRETHQRQASVQDETASWFASAYVLDDRPKLERRRRLARPTADSLSRQPLPEKGGIRQGAPSLALEALGRRGGVQPVARRHSRLDELAVVVAVHGVDSSTTADGSRNPGSPWSGYPAVLGPISSLARSGARRPQLASITVPGNRQGHTSQSGSRRASTEPSPHPRPGHHTTVGLDASLPVRMPGTAGSHVHL
jgi:hypothetical protein